MPAQAGTNQHPAWIMIPPTEPRTTDEGTGPEDLILVRSALRGDSGAVDGVLTRLSCITRFVYRLNRSLGYGLRGEALEDVVQQVYMAVWPRLRDYAGCAALESWVYGFCRNCVRAEARRRSHGKKMVTMVLDELDQTQPATGALPPEEVVLAERADAVLVELDRLRPSEREVVRLRHLEGWSFEQIARQQSEPASTVKDRCYRALMKLKGRLKRLDVSA